MRTASLALLALVGALALLAGCAEKSGGEPFRAFANGTSFSDQEVWAAYHFAAANPGTLQYIPCYCGCDKQGHENNQDCYIKSRHPDGSIIYEPHAAG